MLSKYAQMIIALEDPLLDNWGYSYNDGMLVQLASGAWLETTYGRWYFEENQLHKPVPHLMQLHKYSCLLHWDLFLFDVVNHFSEYDTAEEAALACIMYERYQKKWDGAKWVKFNDVKGGDC